MINYSFLEQCGYKNIEYLFNAENIYYYNVSYGKKLLEVKIVDLDGILSVWEKERNTDEWYFLDELK